jgi:hypothetical protein
VLARWGGNPQAIVSSSSPHRLGRDRRRKAVSDDGIAEPGPTKFDADYCGAELAGGFEEVADLPPSQAVSLDTACARIVTNPEVNPSCEFVAISLIEDRRLQKKR